MTDTERWGRLKAEWERFYPRYYAKGLSATSTECRRLVDALNSEYASDHAPEAPTDADLEAARLVLHQQVYEDSDGMEDVVRRWVDEGGGAFATRALLALTRYKREWLEGSGQALCVAEVDDALDQLRNEAWGFARRTLGGANEKNRAEAAEVARQAFGNAGLSLRLLLAYLFPEEDFFTEEDRQWGLTTTEGESPARWLYALASIRKTPLADRWLELQDHGELVAAIGDEAVGTLRLGILNAWGPWCREAGEALATIETQTAADVLAEHAHHSHIGPIAFRVLRADPARGVVALTRHLAAGLEKRGGKNRHHRSKPRAAQSLLSSIVTANREVAKAARASLDENACAILDAVLDETAPRPEADASELPAILASPPWRSPKKKTKDASKSADKKPKKAKKAGPRPTLLAYEERLDWGEIDPATLTQINSEDPPTEKSDAKLLARIAIDQKRDPTFFLFQICWLTDDAALRVLMETPVDTWYGHDDDVEAPLARFGLAPLERLIAFVTRRPDRAAGLRHVDSPRVAPLFAHCYASVRKTRETGEAWLRARPRAAAIGLVPELFDAKGKARKAAEEGVRFLAAEHGEILSDVAAAYGDEASALVSAFIGSDPSPLAQMTRAPKLPKFFDPASLPRPLLRSGKALSLASVEDLATLLAVAPPGERLRELDAIVAACDPASLARFSWSLFTEWLLSGAAAKDKWAFFALSWFGDADAARELGPMIKEWAPGGFPSRAQLGIDVLAAMGSDAALLEIHKTAERVQSKALARHAKKTMDAIAKARGLSREGLADMLVPDLDLDENGSRVFDFGARRFQVRFDEQLAASVVDEAGNERKDLPKPNAGDDADLAEEARKAFGAMKKEARAIAKDRIVRLERAMIEGRSWPRDTFLSFFALHPLLGHLARRLVWGVVDGGPRDVEITFRVAEDGSLATIDDAPLDLSPDASVIVVHPAALDATLVKRWGDVFSDYELLQPFPQLGREVPTLTEGERDAHVIDRWPNPAPTKRVLRLTRRGWRGSETEQGGMMLGFARELADVAGVVALDPGVYAGDPDMHDTQRVGPFVIRRGSQEVAISEVDPIVVRELIADIESVFGD